MTRDDRKREVIDQYKAKLQKILCNDAMEQTGKSARRKRARQKIKTKRDEKEEENSELKEEAQRLRRELHESEEARRIERAIYLRTVQAVDDRRHNEKLLLQEEKAEEVAMLQVIAAAAVFVELSFNNFQIEKQKLQKTDYKNCDKLARVCAVSDA